MLAQLLGWRTNAIILVRFHYQQEFLPCLLGFLLNIEAIHIDTGKIVRYWNSPHFLALIVDSLNNVLQTWAAQVYAVLELQQLG